jgi:hypothetical protein
VEGPVLAWADKLPDIGNGAVVAVKISLKRGWFGGFREGKFGLKAGRGIAAIFFKETKDGKG